MSIFNNIFGTEKNEIEVKVKNTFAEVPTLSTERLTLCKITEEHAQDMYEYSCDPDVTRYLTWSCHSNPSQTLRYIKLLQKKYADGPFNDWGIVLKEHGKFIGTCGYTSFDFDAAQAEMGYVIAKPYWGKGYAAEALKCAMQYAVENFGIKGFHAKHMEGNDASGKVMQKCGMKFEGMYKHSMFIKGEFKNIVVYRCTSEEFLDKIKG
jgi:ribosomal-protein-alanine N-acetyltransferase